MPCKDIIMVIPGFVKTGQMVQTYKSEGQTKRGHTSNKEIFKLCILEPLPFLKANVKLLLCPNCLCVLSLLLLNQLTDFHHIRISYI